MVAEHPLWKTPVILALNLNMDQQPGRVAVPPDHMHQFVHMLLALRLLRGHMLQGGILKQHRLCLLNTSMHLRKEEGERQLKEALQCFFPCAIKITGGDAWHDTAHPGKAAQRRAWHRAIQVFVFRIGGWHALQEIPSQRGKKNTDGGQRAVVSSQRSQFSILQ